VTDELSWEVYVDNKGRIEIPSTYVLLSGIPEGESFQIKLGENTIILVREGDPAVGWNDQYVERESDGAMILRFLTETNEYNRNHVITEDYTRMINCCENDKYEVTVGKKQIRLTFKG
jgi:bifunctional DNA-binding transcriptional regulator/antitoxin component of YhaV-PrlF toxin-antitoxin module